MSPLAQEPISIAEDNNLIINNTDEVRESLIDQLIYSAVFGSGKKKGDARWIIKKLAKN